MGPAERGARAAPAAGSPEGTSASDDSKGPPPSRPLVGPLVVLGFHRISIFFFDFDQAFYTETGVLGGPGRS